MNFHRTRLLVPALLSTAGLAVAGCGGGGGGDKDAYVKTYEAGCGKLAGALKTLQSDAAAGVAQANGDQKKAFAPTQKATLTFFGSVKAQFTNLSDADAPSEFSDFQDDFKDAAGKLVDKLDESTQKVEDAKDLKTLTTALSAFGSLKPTDVKVPDALSKAAPACKAIDVAG